MDGHQVPGSHVFTKLQFIAWRDKNCGPGIKLYPPVN